MVRLDPLNEDMGQTPSQTARPTRKIDTKNQPGVKRHPTEELGESEGVDPENVGDIADEGTGRRG
jgi:hypothetical protein